MGCFSACFGGGGGKDRRHQKLRRRSPSRSPPRPVHVALVDKASSVADVVVKEASPPLPEARAFAPPPLPEARAFAPPPLPEARALAPPLPEFAEDLATDASSRRELRELSEQGVLTSLSPTVIEILEEVITAASPARELRGLSQHKASPTLSLPEEKKITTPLSPVKCLPVVSAVVSAPIMELRGISEQERRDSGKKKVTFDMNVTTYENTTLPDQEEELSESVKCIKDEDERHMQKTVLLPENHRYRNCTDSDDDGDDIDGDECGEDANYGGDSEEEEDFMDCKIDSVDEEEISIAESKEESHESLFSLPMSKDQQNDQEVSSPIPKSSGTSAQEESPLVQGNNHRDRSQYVRPVSNPVQNLAQWKEVKAQAAPVKRLYKENVNSVPDASPISINQTKMTPGNSSKGEVSVDASLSTWLVSSDNSTVDKAQSKSPRSISSVRREERPVLGALTVDDLKRSSATSSPRRSPSQNCEEVPILGTVGSYWSTAKQGNEYCSSGSSSGTNGIPNSTSKYREDRRVNWHSTPFKVRLDKALKKSST